MNSINIDLFSSDFSGQAIPPGLHIRLNLQTGLREAKLLEDTPQKSVSNDLIPISTDNEDKERISKQNLERAFANLDLSKDDVITDKVRFPKSSISFDQSIFFSRNTKKKLKENFVPMMN